jgi:ESCRT-II complex subunit VPS22
MKRQMETFKSHLQQFAVKYQKDIRQDPRFRSQFQQMCTRIGVDPLASTPLPVSCHFIKLITIFVVR